MNFLAIQYFSLIQELIFNILVNDDSAKQKYFAVGLAASFWFKEEDILFLFFDFSSCKRFNVQSKLNKSNCKRSSGHKLEDCLLIRHINEMYG